MLAALIYQSTLTPTPPIPVASDQNTPGRDEPRITRKDWWLPKPESVREQPLKNLKLSKAQEGDYASRSAMVRARISFAEAEAAVLRGQVSALEAAALADGIRTLAEQRRLEREALLAKQQLTMLAVQEAVLREEMEVIDVAYLAAVVVTTMQ